jgi:acetylglutamate kinase
VSPPIDTDTLSDTIVLKLGGEVVQSADLPIIARDIATLKNAVVVHGGGKYATDLQKQLGQTPTIVGGRRVTDAATLDVMKMVVAGKMNVDLCAALSAAGGKPVGLHGASSSVIEAYKRPPKVIAGQGDAPVDLGLVGDVAGLNEALLRLLLGAGYTPVLACLGGNNRGEVFNINADTVANAVATKLSAKGLVLISDVPGVLRDIRDPNSRIGSINKRDAALLIADGTVSKGMVPKLEEAFAAIDAGVRAVFIVGKLGPGDLERAVREPGSVGTVLIAD